MEKKNNIILTECQKKFLNKDWFCLYHLEKGLEKFNIASYTSLLNNLIPETKKKKTKFRKNEEEIKRLSEAIKDNLYKISSDRKSYIPTHTDLEKNIPILSDEDCEKKLYNLENINSSEIREDTIRDTLVNRLPNDVIEQIIKIDDINFKAIELDNLFKKIEKENKYEQYKNIIDIERNIRINNKIPLFSRFIMTFRNNYFIDYTNNYDKSKNNLFVNDITNVNPNIKNVDPDTITKYYYLHTLSEKISTLEKNILEDKSVQFLPDKDNFEKLFKFLVIMYKILEVGNIEIDDNHIVNKFKDNLVNLKTLTELKQNIDNEVLQKNIKNIKNIESMIKILKIFNLKLNNSYPVIMNIIENIENNHNNNIILLKCLTIIKENSRNNNPFNIASGKKKITTKNLNI